MIRSHRNQHILYIFQFLSSLAQKLRCNLFLTLAARTARISEQPYTVDTGETALDIILCHALFSVRWCADCHLDMRKRLAIFVVLLSLLVTVHLTAWSRIFATIKRPPLRDTVSNAATLTNSSAASARTRDVSESVIVVDVDGNFTDRIAHFNVQLRRLRQQLSLTLPETTCRTSASDSWTANGGLRTGPLQVVSGIAEDYFDELRDNPDIITVVLPWLRSRDNWSSLTDFSNVLYQRYYEWTADDVFCTWMETPGVIKARYDSMYRRTCNRNINDTAHGQSLRPLFLCAKPFNRNHYWPNNGDSYPEHVYTTTPPYVFYMHIHRDAVVTELGDVITARTKLVLYDCTQDLTPRFPLGGKLSQIPCYDEVYVITQFWGNEVFHRMAEVVPRLGFCLQFLKAHQEIRILGPQVGGRLAELLEIIGLDKSRLITGVTRAKIVYQPRATGCGFANAQESQMLSRLYGDYIKRTFPSQPRNRLILIRRSANRKFTEQKEIEEVLKRVARDYNLTYTLFNDNPTPSLNDTMTMFHSAVIVVAPHGAGLSNVFFSQPGTYVVEGVCNLPHVNLCFQRLTHILGHHWHGVTSRGGCESVVDVSATSVEDAVRSYLRLWMLESSS